MRDRSPAEPGRGAQLGEGHPLPVPDLAALCSEAVGPQVPPWKPLRRPLPGPQGLRAFRSTGTPAACALCLSEFTTKVSQLPNSSKFTSFTLHIIICNFIPKTSTDILFICIYLPAPGLSCVMWDLVPRPGIKPRAPCIRRVES